jgi:Uma2 family endonuclease
MRPARFVVDPHDPRAPSQEVWDRLSDAERRQLVASLPSEIPRAEPPEGDAHRIPKTRALESLDEYYRRIRRRVYLSAELPIYYPGEPMFAPDLIAVLDVELHERNSWVVSHERRGLDFVLEIHVAGDARKDFEHNVGRCARLGIPEYFAFDPTRRRLLGWRLPSPSARAYEPVVPQDGRWRSGVLELDLALEQDRLRFFHGSAPLLDARELIGRLSSMVDDAVRRAEEEARRAEEEARRAEEEARRAEQEARRAERLAARLRTLGVDPDEVD